jgi:hypothetical protein
MTVAFGGTVFLSATYCLEIGSTVTTRGVTNIFSVFSGNRTSGPIVKVDAVSRAVIIPLTALSGSLRSVNRFLVSNKIPEVSGPTIGGDEFGGLSSEPISIGREGFQPAIFRYVNNSSANDHGSGQSFWYRNSTFAGFFAFASGARNFAGSIWRGAVWRRKIAKSNSAFAARRIASASLAFDRLRNSVWIRASFLLNRTSPTIPRAITVSAMAVPHCSRNESYGGWMAAMANSATSATTTAPAHPHSHRSHDDDADSNWFSLAFIVPFGKRHAGNEFRGFWVGAGLVALIFVVLFAVSFVVK